MKTFPPEHIGEAVNNKGYRWFENDREDYNLNIVGIRSYNRRANEFDDTMTISWKYRGVWKSLAYPCTTDPGQYWLSRLMNPRGCAILVPGQYLNTYALDLHNDRYEALCQRLGPVKVYRDKNRNIILDMDPTTITSGRYGINIHHGEYRGITEKVGIHSAGCQVFQRFDDFVRAREVWRAARDSFGNSFTYTLLEEKDFS